MPTNKFCTPTENDYLGIDLYNRIILKNIQMKKNIQLLIFVFIHLSAFTQAPVLDSANIVHKNGDSIFYWGGYITYYNPGNQGANVLWDFSNINFTIPVTSPSQLIYTFIYVNPPMYLQPGSNIVDYSMSPTGNEVKRFYFADVNKLVCVGDQTTPVYDCDFLPPRYIFKFPFTYLSGFSDSTTYHLQYDGNGSSTTANNKIYYNVLADGWGSLKILNKTHLQVLRVRTISHWADSSTSYFHGNVSSAYCRNGIDTTYQWFKPNTYEALLTMSTSWEDSSGVWINSQSGYISPYGLDYLSSYLNINENNISQNLIISPNPSANKLTLSLQQNYYLPNTKVSIYNSEGILKLQQTMDQPLIVVNISHYAKGIYIVKVNNDKHIMVSKFLKE